MTSPGSGVIVIVAGAFANTVATIREEHTMRNAIRNAGLIAAGGLAAAALLAAVAMSEGGPPDHGLGNNAAGVRGAAEAVWMTVASAGAVDDADGEIYNAKAGTMTIRSDAPGRSFLNVRYNVVAVEELVGPADDVWQMGVRYRDNGPEARVLVKLREYRLLDGGLSTLWVFDSDDFAASSQWQTRVIERATSAFDFDWNNASYYLEVIISRDDASGRPGLGMVGIAEL